MSERRFLSTSLRAAALGLGLLLAACGGGGGGGGGDSGRDEGNGGVAEQWQLDLREGSRGTCELTLTRRRDGAVRADGTLLYRRTDGGQIDRYEVDDAAVTIDSAAREVTVNADNVAFSGGGDIPGPGVRVVTFLTTWSLTQLTGYFSVNDESNSQRLGVRARKEAGSGVTDGATPAPVGADRLSAEGDADLSGAEDPAPSEELPAPGEDGTR